MKTNIRNILLLGLLALTCAGTIQAQELTQQPAQERSVVIRDGGTYYCGDLQMNGAAYKRFLETECPQAFQQYKQGQQCMIAGWSLLGFGVVGMPVAFVGWLVSGFGVVISDAVNSEEPADPEMVAVNGTLRPISREYGIAPEIFHGTIDNWSDERARERFLRRMAGSAAAAASLPKPERTPLEQQRELAALAERIERGGDVPDIYTAAVIGAGDRIFPAEVQQDFWQNCPETEIVHADMPHCPLAIPGFRWEDAAGND